MLDLMKVGVKHSDQVGVFLEGGFRFIYNPDQVSDEEDDGLNIITAVTILFVTAKISDALIHASQYLQDTLLDIFIRLCLELVYLQHWIEATECLANQLYSIGVEGSLFSDQIAYELYGIKDRSAVIATLIGFSYGLPEPRV